MRVGPTASPPCICPVLVGRDPELRALATLLDDVCDGSSRVAIVGGEAGIGKTRLLGELVALATQRSVTVLSGRCFPQDRAYPLAPIRDLARAAGHPFADSTLGAAASTDDGRTGRATRGTTDIDREHDKRRLFRALGDLVEAVAAAAARSQSPSGHLAALVLALEDLHWCDDTTLEWLPFLFLQTARPMLLVVSHRRDEGHATLDAFLAAMERTRSATEIDLRRLERSGVADMIRAILGPERTAPAALVDEHARLSDGNPLFVEEMLKSTLAATPELATARPDGATERAVHVPRTLRLAVQARVATLHAEARKVLSLGAVVGRRFDVDLVRDLLEIDESQLIAIVRELVDAQLLVEESPESLAFRHALTREIVYGELLAIERRAMHRRVARALQLRAAGASRLADLSYHYDAAGLWDETLRWAELAGRDAMSLCAPGAAAAHYTRALDAAERLGNGRFAALLPERAQAYDWLGRFDLARSDHERALDLARSAHDQRAEWRCLLDLGILSRERDVARAAELFAAALAMARVSGDRAALAQTLGWVGFAAMMSDRPFEARRHQEEALAIFRKLRDRRGIARLLDHLGWTHYVCADLRAMNAAYARAAELFRDLADPLGHASSLAGLATRGADYYQLASVWTDGDAETRMREGSEAVAFARKIAWRSGEARALIWLGLCLGAHGAYGRALAAAREGLRIAESDQQVRYVATAHCLLGAIGLDVLALDLARTHLARATELARQMGSPTVLAAIASFAARVEIEAGELEAASRILRESNATKGSERSMPQRLCDSARAELSIASGRMDDALEQLETLIADAPNIDSRRGRRRDASARGLGSHRRRSDERAIIPHLEHLRAKALAGAGRWTEAEAAFDRAAVAANALGQGPVAFRVAVARSAAAQRQGKLEEAAAAQADARRILETLASSLLPDTAARDAFSAAGNARLPALPASARSRDVLALTTREREVVGLLAQGMSNRAIGRRLFISERTVEKHVENVLSKLGLESRVQIAVWAVEHPHAARSRAR